MMNVSFYKGKSVFVTGHTGFKGSWLCKILVDAGAHVTGYALESKEEQNLFHILRLEEKMYSNIGDIRDLSNLKKVFEECQPEIVIHLAAQPLVREGYVNPVYTYETNVMGSVNILECIRKTASVKSFLNVTTDKVYENKEWDKGYKETDILDGYDPYSNSKSCSELVSHSYKKSFLADRGIAISTARAGNVIGGGDFADNRIIPDCIRAVVDKKKILVRNPYSVRPYQHVLEPLFAYLLILEKQYEEIGLQGWYNVGPDDKDCVNTGELVSAFCELWGSEAEWRYESDNGPHEAGLLKLNCGKIASNLGWKPCWNYKKALEKTIEWTKCFYDGNDVIACTEKQIKDYMKDSTYILEGE